MYNYLSSSLATVSITICVWTSGCKFTKTSNFPRDLISLEGCIKDGLIFKLSNCSMTFDISVGLTDP